MEREECEDRVAAFLQRHDDYSVSAPLPATLPAMLVSVGGFLQTLPSLHNVDGAFAARLVRCQ